MSSRRESPTLAEVLDCFVVDADTCTVTPLGHGNINETFFVQGSEDPFVLQRINGAVFPNPRCVAENFAKIAAHYDRKQELFGPRLQLARPVASLDGRNFITDSAGKLWRAQNYLPDASNQPKDKLQVEELEQTGKILAIFHLFLAGMGKDELEIPVPGFHDLPRYLEIFDCLGVNFSINANTAADSVCRNTISRFRGRATVLEEAKASGELLLRPIHGDPKLDNFIFNAVRQPVGLLDLDTVGPGLIQYDLGDCLRSCCNPAGEIGASGKQLFKHDYCRAMLKGYVQEAGNLLTDVDKDYIFDGLLLIPYELGVRFYTDHLQGDIYFKVQRPGENLQRALVQFQLTREIEKEEAAIRKLVDSL